MMTLSLSFKWPCPMPQIWPFTPKCKSYASFLCKNTLSHRLNLHHLAKLLFVSYSEKLPHWLHARVVWNVVLKKNCHRKECHTARVCCVYFSRVQVTTTHIFMNFFPAWDAFRFFLRELEHISGRIPENFHLSAKFPQCYDLNPEHFSVKWSSKPPLLHYLCKNARSLNMLYMIQSFLHLLLVISTLHVGVFPYSLNDGRFLTLILLSILLPFRYIKTPETQKEKISNHSKRAAPFLCDIWK